VSDAPKNPDMVDDLLDRLSRASTQIADAAEERVRDLDRRMRELVERSEGALNRVLETVEQQSRAQIAGLKREVGQLEQRLAQVRTRVPSRRASAEQTVKTAKTRSAKSAKAAKTAAAKTAKTAKAAKSKAAKTVKTTKSDTAKVVKAAKKRAKAAADQAGASAGKTRARGV
jgi:uncharacterized protein YukE